MSKQVYIALLLLFCFPFYGQSNDSLQVNFKMGFDKNPLELNKEYITLNKDKIKISTFKCYVSAIEIHYEDKTVFKKQNSFHLLDLENSKSLQIPITKKNDKKISKIVFNIGIDSLTNTSGAMSGDLDPTKGMYWAWQSGYINMKIEGKSPSCAPEVSGRKNQFQFHIGGYLHPFYAMRRKEINVNSNFNSNDNINIVIDVSTFFKEIHLENRNSIMVPGKTAMELADVCTKMFYIE